VDASVGSFYQRMLLANAHVAPYSADVRAHLQAKHTNEAQDFLLHLDADALYDDQDTNRRYVYLNEAKAVWQTDDATISVGNIIGAWGKMDIYSPIDTLNARNLLKDPLANDKLGATALQYRHYLDNGEWEVTVKFLETMQSLPYTASPYYFLDPKVCFGDLESHLVLWRPTLFARYSTTVEMGESSFDHTFILANGFDAIRGVIDGGQNDDFYDLTPLLFYSTKAMYAIAVPLEAWILKSEMALAYSEDSRVSHYGQLALAAEYATQTPWGQSLLYLSEYHRFVRWESTKLSALQLMQFFQNDWVIGVRMGLNDAYNSALMAAIIVDMEGQGSATQLSFNSKLIDSVSYSLRWLHLVPRDATHSTALPASSFDAMVGSFLDAIGAHDSITVGLTYHF